MQIFRKEPFFYGHDNHDQLVKIAKVAHILIGRNLKFIIYIDNNLLFCDISVTHSHWERDICVTWET